MATFPEFLELWGDGPLPPLPPGPQPFFGVLTWAPWAGPIVDAAVAKSALIRQRLQDGKIVPAHTYTEFSTLTVSPWWSPVIMSLHADASQEENRIKLSFENKYPYWYRRQRLPCRDVLTFPPSFLRDRILLHTRLAYTQAIFWIQTREETGATAAANALQNARLGARAAAAAAADEQEYTWALLRDDYLAAWLACDTVIMGAWGTSCDPRIGPWGGLPKPVHGCSGSPDLPGWGSTAAWSTQSGDWASISEWGTGSWDHGPMPPPQLLRFRTQ
ncbi:hypothetical protein C8R45DRAFT_1089390 [Mycena sanguinolenta]|nr:hypothetical protein C8R45DRAFT_1089390 [Mycena sanguinolenta]